MNKKRISKMVFILFTVLLLTACKEESNQKIDNNEENEPATVQIEETIEIQSENNNENQSEAVSEEEAQAASEETSVSQPKLPEEEEPAYSVKDMSATLFAKKAVNIRKGPTSDYEKIGALKKGDAVTVTGIADTGWYRISYNEQEAFVSDAYLLDEASYTAMIEQEAYAAIAAASEEQAAGQSTTQQTVIQSQTADTGDFKGQVVAIMNTERANNGIGAITESAELDSAAQIRAQEIASYFSHTRPNGTSCFSILDDNAIVYYTAGENIAAGQKSPQEVMTAWMNSEGHRANILTASFGKVGIGYYTASDAYGTYWVQLFTD